MDPAVPQFIAAK